MEFKSITSIEELIKESASSLPLNTGDSSFPAASGLRELSLQLENNLGNIKWHSEKALLHKDYATESLETIVKEVTEAIETLEALKIQADLSTEEFADKMNEKRRQFDFPE